MSKILFKKYIPVTYATDKCNFIKFQITFNKETHHWATSSMKEKGYQVTATPVQKTKSECGTYSTEAFTAFQGFYEIIYPAQRQSKNGLINAIIAFNKRFEFYKKYFIDKGFKLVETTE